MKTTESQSTKLSESSETKNQKSLQIISCLNNNSVLQIFKAENNPYAKLTISKNNKAKNQQFVFEKIEDNYYIIKVLHTNLVLDVEGGKPGIHDVIQYPFHGGYNQQWCLESAKNGNVFIKSRLGFYLDVEGGNSNDNTKLIVYPFHGDANQQFKIVEINN